MSERSRVKRAHGSGNARQRQATLNLRHVAGLGVGASACLALGINTFGGVPTARADGFDAILDPIVNSISHALTESFTAADPAATLDAGHLLGDFDALDLGSGAASAAAVPAETSAAASTDSISSGDAVYLPVKMVGESPIIDVSAGGGPSIPVLLDTGSNGLVIPAADVSFPTLMSAIWNDYLQGDPVVYGGYGDGANSVQYLGVEVPTTVTLGDAGDQVVTDEPSNVTVVLASTGPPTNLIEQLLGYHLDFGSLQGFGSADGVLGIGPNAGGPEELLNPGTQVAGVSVTDALPGDLKDGEFIQLNGPDGAYVPGATSVIGFGSNQDLGIAGPSTVHGPVTQVQVSIDGGMKQTVDDVRFDSGAQNGWIPQSLVPDDKGDANVPAGTNIAVYNMKGDLLYEYTTTANDAPGIQPGSDMNTGIAAFEYGGNKDAADLFYDPDHQGIYISNTGQGSVEVQAPPPPPPPPPTDPGVVATIATNGNPIHVAVSPTGPEAGDIYVVNDYVGQDYGPVAVIDPSTNTVVHNIGIFNTTDAIAVSPTGPEAGDIYVANEGGNSVSVIDPSTNTIVHTIGVGDAPHAIAVSSTGPEAGDIYVANDDSVSVIDPSTNTVVQTIGISWEGPDGLAVSPESGEIYASDGNGDIEVIDPSTNAVARFIDAHAYFSSLTVSPTGPEAGDIYATSYDDAGNDTLIVIDPSTGNIVTTAVDGTHPAGDAYGATLAVSPTGPQAGDVYVDTDDSDTIEVFDPSTNTIDHTLNIDPNGFDVAVSPTGPEAGDIYVTNLGSGTVSVLEP